MFTPTNPEAERIRAEAILRSFTDYNEAVKLFAPTGLQAEKAELEADRSNRRSIVQVFKAIKLNRRRVVDASVQQFAYSPRQVTTSGCSE